MRWIGVHAGLECDLGAAVPRPFFNELLNGDGATRADVDDKLRLNTKPRESREVICHVFNRQVVAQLIPGAHRKKFVSRLACALELTVERLQTLSWPIRIEEPCPNDGGHGIHPQKMLMKEHFRARVFRYGGDGVCFLNLALFQTVFKACPCNNNLRKALASECTQEFHVPRKFAFHVVDRFIVGEPTPRQVHQDFWTSKSLESISRRCSEVELHEVPRPRSCLSARAKDFDDFMASVNERLRDMSADEAGRTRQGNFHREARSIVVHSVCYGDRVE